MTKQIALSEYSSFLDEMHIKYRLPHSGNTLNGLMDKLVHYRNCLDDSNIELTDKANELLLARLKRCIEPLNLQRRKR